MKATPVSHRFIYVKVLFMAHGPIIPVVIGVTKNK
jgi:hypothetical protein